MMRNVTTEDERSPDLVAMVAARIDAAVVKAAGPFEVSACLKLSEDEKRGPLGSWCFSCVAVHQVRWSSGENCPSGKIFPGVVDDARQGTAAG